MARRPKLRAVRARLPGSDADPTGQDQRILSARADFRRRLKEAKQAYIDAFEQIPRQLTNAARYTYQLDPARLTTLLQDLGEQVDRLLLEGRSAERLWFVQQYVMPAYARGTQTTWTNIVTQSVPYAELRPGIETILYSQAYQNRVGLIAARVFEDMVGFTAETRSKLARELADGMALGLGPREVAKRMTGALEIQERRALMVARTEINNAFRQARMDESDSAAQTLGLRVMMMQFSARSPSTRPSHAARHAKLYTTTELREWWASGAEAINCKCTCIEVLVDADGKPLDPTIQERAKARHKG